MLLKIKQIAKIIEDNSNHCKNLKKPLQNFKRVHVNNGFVLIFQIDKKNKTMIIVDYEHHNNVYDKVYRTT